MFSEKFHISMVELERDLKAIYDSNFFLPIDPSCKLEYDISLENGGLFLTTMDVFNDCLGRDDQDTLRTICSDIFFDGKEEVLPLFSYPSNMYIGLCKKVFDKDESIYGMVVLQDIGQSYQGYIIHSIKVNGNTSMIVRNIRTGKDHRDYFVVQDQATRRRIKILEKTLADYSNDEYQNNKLLFF